MKNSILPSIYSLNINETLANKLRMRTFREKAFVSIWLEFHICTAHLYDKIFTQIKRPNIDEFFS